MPPEVTCAEDVSHLSGKIPDRHGYVTSVDQTRLFYRHWPASAAWNGRVVVVLHGIGYHSAPYKVIADALNPHGTDVYGLDSRGTDCPRDAADSWGLRLRSATTLNA